MCEDLEELHKERAHITNQLDEFMLKPWRLKQDCRLSYVNRLLNALRDLNVQECRVVGRLINEANALHP